MLSNAYDNRESRSVEQDEEYKYPFGYRGNVSQDTRDQVESVLANMSTEQKIGQMFMLGWDGTGTEDIAALINSYHIGNVIIMGNNVENPSQVQQACNSIQNLRSANNGIPMIIAIDQEGGTINRITTELVIYPSQQDICSYASPAQAVRVADYTSTQLLALGINTVLGPVLDINTNPDNTLATLGRCFSSDVDKVIEYGGSYITGFKDSRIIFATKHFPGYGDVEMDPHDRLPASGVSLDILRSRELLPFQRAIELGTPMIMTSHILLPMIQTGEDSMFSATFSPFIIDGILRQEMGYSGVVITDDLDMGAVKYEMTAREIAEYGINAGIDILLLAHNPGKQVDMIESVRDLVAAGNISMERIEESVRRILTLKFQYFDIVGGARDKSQADLIAFIDTREQNRLRDTLINQIPSSAGGEN